MRVHFLVGLLTACSSVPRREPPAPTLEVAASPASLDAPTEIHTLASSDSTIDVLVACRSPGVGMVSRGEHRKPDRADATAFNRWADHIRAQIEAELGELTPGVGFGVGCTDDARGPRVYVRRYADIDPVVERLRAFLIRERLEVSLYVTVMGHPQLL